MKIGLSLSDFTLDEGPTGLPAYLKATARAADDCGFESLWVMDRGRAWFGIGAAWFEREHLGLGVPWPSRAERFERLEETLRIVLQMWSGKVGPFAGKHYQLAETLNAPPTTSRPRPRILVGGGGERKTLRLVAQYADACNIQGSDLDVLVHKLAVLRQHCGRLGRDYDAIEKTSTILDIDRDMSSAQVVDKIARLAAPGVQHVVLANWGFKDVASLERIARDVMPQVEPLS